MIITQQHKPSDISFVHETIPLNLRGLERRQRHIVGIRRKLPHCARSSICGSSNDRAAEDVSPEPIVQASLNGSLLILISLFFEEDISFLIFGPFERDASRRHSYHPSVNDNLSARRV